MKNWTIEMEIGLYKWKAKLQKSKHGTIKKQTSSKCINIFKYFSNKDWILSRIANFFRNTDKNKILQIKEDTLYVVTRSKVYKIFAICQIKIKK